MTDQQYMEKMNPVDREAFETCKKEYDDLVQDLNNASDTIIRNMNELLEEHFVHPIESSGAELLLNTRLNLILDAADELKLLKKDYNQRKLMILDQMEELKARTY